MPVFHLRAMRKTEWKGIFIKEDDRSQGYIKELSAECEVWAEANSLTHFTRIL